MKNRSTAIVAFIFITACIGASSAHDASAPGPAPSSAEDYCLTKLLNMSDCLSYVTEGSNLTVPDKACCPELAGLVDSNPICLCQLLGKNDSYGIKIDLNRALKLPSVCRVTTPPVSLCSATQGSLSPGVQPPGGLAASPPTGNNDNAASGNACSVLLSIIVGLAFVFLI